MIGVATNRRSRSNGAAGAVAGSGVVSATGTTPDGPCAEASNRRPIAASPVYSPSAMSLPVAAVVVILCFPLPLAPIRPSVMSPSAGLRSLSPGPGPGLHATRAPRRVYRSQACPAGYPMLSWLWFAAGFQRLNVVAVRISCYHRPGT